MKEVYTFINFNAIPFSNANPTFSNENVPNARRENRERECALEKPTMRKTPPFAKCSQYTAIDKNEVVYYNSDIRLLSDTKEIRE